VQATKYSARFNTFPPSILAISLERRCMLPNPARNGIPRVRGFATAPGSSLGCVR
jgi:hypothetical protein